MAKVYITSGTSWAGVATDGSDITVECIGGGAGDIIRIDVDTLSTTKPKGLIVTLEFRLP